MRHCELRRLLKEDRHTLNEGLSLGDVGLGALALVAGAGLLFAKGVVNFAKTGDIFKSEDHGFGSSDKGLFALVSKLFTNHMLNSGNKDVRAVAEKMRQMRLALSKNPEEDLAGVVDTILEFADGEETHEEVAKKISKDTLNQLRIYNIWNKRANEIMKQKETLGNRFPKEKEAVEKKRAAEKNKVSEENEFEWDDVLAERRGSRRKNKNKGKKKATEQKPAETEVNNAPEQKSTDGGQKPTEQKVPEQKSTDGGQKSDFEYLMGFEKGDITPTVILYWNKHNYFKRKLSDEEKELLEQYENNKVSLTMDDIKEVWEICKKIIKEQYDGLRSDYIGLVDKIGDLDANKAKILLDDLKSVDEDLYNELKRGVDDLAKKQEKEKEQGKKERWTERERQNACVLAAILIFGQSILGNLKNESEWRKNTTNILRNAGVKNIDENLLIMLYNYDGIQGIQEGTRRALSWVTDIIDKPEKINPDVFKRKLYDYKVNGNDAREVLARIRGTLDNQHLDETEFRKLLGMLTKFTWEKSDEESLQSGNTKKESYSKLSDLRRMYEDIKVFRESVQNMRSLT